MRGPSMRNARLQAVVPVCGIGTYEYYLTSACCVCEVNAGGLTYAMTGDLLAMVAPRRLLVVSATRDALQFSAEEAAKNIGHACQRFRLLGHEERIRRTVTASGHDYNQPMREAMYGWLEHSLKQEGNGGPPAEPVVTPEDPQAPEAIRMKTRLRDEILGGFPGPLPPEITVARGRGPNTLHARAEHPAR